MTMEFEPADGRFAMTMTADAQHTSMGQRDNDASDDHDDHDDHDADAKHTGNGTLSRYCNYWQQRPHTPHTAMARAQEPHNRSQLCGSSGISFAAPKHYAAGTEPSGLGRYPAAKSHWIGDEGRRQAAGSEEADSYVHWQRRPGVDAGRANRSSR